MYLQAEPGAAAASPNTGMLEQPIAFERDNDQQLVLSKTDKQKPKTCPLVCPPR